MAKKNFLFAGIGNGARASCFILSLIETATHYYHEGVDFRGKSGTDIISFIQGEVIAYGLFEKYGRTIFIADMNSSSLYLLAHLKSYNKTVLDKGIVHPGDKIGEVGTSGLGSTEADCDGKYDSHLHITYFPKIHKKSIYLAKDGQKLKIKAAYNSDFIASKRNPFIHNSEPKGVNS